MLTFLMRFRQDLEQFFPDCNWSSLVADLFLPLYHSSSVPAQMDFLGQYLTSGVFGSFGNKVNIFFTQNLEIDISKELKPTVNSKQFDKSCLMKWKEESYRN
jgi:hypothetical protein